MAFAIILPQMKKADHELACRKIWNAGAYLLLHRAAGVVEKVAAV